MTNHLNNQTPEQRAQRDVYRQDMAAQRQALGLPAQGGRGGGGFGGPGGFR